MLYIVKDLEELLSLRRPDGMPLHWGHVIYLITIDRKRDRRRLQKQAAREGWSAPDLYVAIRREFHKESDRGGRPVNVPHSAEAKLRLMVKESDRWLRRCEAVLQEGNHGLLEELKALPDGTAADLRWLLEDRLKEMLQVTRRPGRRISRPDGTADGS